MLTHVQFPSLPIWFMFHAVFADQLIQSLAKGPPFLHMQLQKWIHMFQ